MPVPHFGIVLGMAEWQELADRLRAAGVAFAIEPHIRFQGQPGEQATMFFRDPAGNAIEMKAFADRSKLFARDYDGQTELHAQLRQMAYLARLAGRRARS